MGKWIIPGAGLIWLLGCFFLLVQQELAFEIAFTDSFFFGLLFMGGILVVDQVFSLFTPKGKNLWLVLFLPLSLSFLTVYFHHYLLSWWYDLENDYLELLDNSIFLRLVVLGFAFLMIALLALVLSKVERQEELSRREAQMLELSKEAELAQLRQQLQPHFLFNSLNSINALVMTQPQKAREMVLLLSEFLRGTIRKDTHSWISLEEELNYLKMYLDIERVRFGHRLTVDFQIPENLGKAKIPQLLIQPLIENAIKHGLYGLTGEVKIEVTCQKEGNYLLMEVKNPFDPEMVAPAGTGFGLSSVDRRLYLVFGRKDLLEHSSVGNEFKVTLRIPQYQ